MYVLCGVLHFIQAFTYYPACTCVGWCPYIRECSSTLYVGLAHAVPPTNIKFKLLLLPTQVGMPYTNTHKHRTSYVKSTLTFLWPAKCWKSICTVRQKPEILTVLHIIFNFKIFFSNVLTRFNRSAHANAYKFFINR